MKRGWPGGPQEAKHYRRKVAHSAIDQFCIRFKIHSIPFKMVIMKKRNGFLSLVLPKEYSHFLRLAPKNECETSLGRRSSLQKSRRQQPAVAHVASAKIQLRVHVL
jgi:hypothetical protein